MGREHEISGGLPGKGRGGVLGVLVGPSGSTEPRKKMRCPCPPAMPKSREMQRAEGNPIYDLRQKRTMGNHRSISFRKRRCPETPMGKFPNPRGKRRSGQQVRARAAVGGGWSNMREHQSSVLLRGC